MLHHINSNPIKRGEPADEDTLTFGGHLDQQATISEFGNAFRFPGKMLGKLFIGSNNIEFREILAGFRADKKVFLKVGASI